MKRLISAAAATLLMLSAGALHAECVFPSSEIDIPDGSKASKESMIAAIQQVKAYQSEMAAFRTCLDDELAALAEPRPLEALQFHDLRFNASVTSEEEVANKLNNEIRAFKAAGTE
jgi:hypothetical protein